MLKFLFGMAFGGLMMAGIAAAADVLPIAPAFDWTGFYAGTQVGLALAHPNEIGSSSLPALGTEVTAGANLQALWQKNKLVIGAVVDGNISGPIASRTCPNVTRTCEAGSGGDFSARAKLGFASNRVMLYGTGGWGWADFQKSSFVTATGAAHLDDQRMLSGWVAGAGISYAISPKWIGNLEYLHYDLGSANGYAVPGPETLAPTLDTVTVGVSYKLN